MRHPLGFTAKPAICTKVSVKRLRSPAEGEGNEGFPPPPEKDLESPSSMRIKGLVPSRDSRDMTRSPSPRAWRPDFPGAAPEAP